MESARPLKAAPERARKGRELCAQEASHDPAKISEDKGIGVVLNADFGVSPRKLMTPVWSGAAANSPALAG